MNPVRAVKNAPIIASIQGRPAVACHQRQQRALTGLQSSIRHRRGDSIVCRRKNSGKAGATRYRLLTEAPFTAILHSTEDKFIDQWRVQ